MSDDATTPAADDAWLQQVPHYEEFRGPTGTVDWGAWRRAVSAAMDEIVRRESEGETPKS